MFNHLGFILLTHTRAKNPLFSRDSDNRIEEGLIMTKGKTIDEFNFIRAISALGIVIYHFINEIGQTRLLIGNYPWGSIFVTVFFMVSGALLYHNYNEPKNVKLFYYKRWKSLMPDFYVVFFCMYAVNVIVNRSFFYKGQPLTLLLTIIGQDGYLSGIIPNYYILGEWFLGAILILYVIYPLLVKAINKKEAIAVSIIVAMYILSLFIDALGINAFRSVFSCLISFTIGIVIEKHRIYEHRWLAVPALIGFVVENFFIKNAGSNVSAHIGGHYYSLYSSRLED